MKRWGMGVLVLMVTAVLGAGRARAQTGVYAMFDLGHYSGLGVGQGTAANQSGGFTALGGTFGIYDDFAKAGPLGVGADIRLIVDSSANSTPTGDKITGVLTGFRVDANAVVLPFRPYAQVEVGVVGQNNGTNTSRTSSFAYQFQFGGDITIVPHVGARVEYGAGQLDTSGATNHTLQTFSAGLVVRL
jgi:hypothetical protein